MKYRISKFYIGIYLLCLVFLIPLTYFDIICIKLMIEGQRTTGNTEYWLLIPSFLTFIGFAGYLYEIFFGFQFGKFSVDQEGITMIIARKRHFIQWSEIVDAGIIGIGNESVGVGAVSDTYWVYFSTYFLSEHERMCFLSKTRRDLNRIAFFQYNPKVVSEILTVIPAKISEKITYQESLLQKDIKQQ